jgi:hypothetical protein
MNFQLNHHKNVEIVLRARELFAYIYIVALSYLQVARLIKRFLFKQLDWKQGCHVHGWSVLCLEDSR